MDDARDQQGDGGYDGGASQANVVFQQQAPMMSQPADKQYQAVPVQYESEVQRIPAQYQSVAPPQPAQQYQSLAPSIAVSGLKDSSDIDIGPGQHGQYFREYQVSAPMLATSGYVNESSRFLEHSPESFFKPSAVSTSAVPGDDQKEYSDNSQSQYGGYFHTNTFQGSASVLAPVVVKTDGTEVPPEQETQQTGASQKGGFSEPETSSGGFVPMLTHANVYPRAHMKANSPRPVTTRIKAFIKHMLVQKN